VFGTDWLPPAEAAAATAAPAASTAAAAAVDDVSGIMPEKREPQIEHCPDAAAIAAAVKKLSEIFNFSVCRQLLLIHLRLSALACLLAVKLHMYSKAIK
jgi:hypothetical protein